MEGALLSDGEGDDSSKGSQREEVVVTGLDGVSGDE